MSLRLQFMKVRSAGNDFLFYADPAGEHPLTAEQVRFLCDQRFGIGALGVIRAVRTEYLPERAELATQYPEAEWFMDHYGAGGAAAPMCGAGVCAYVHYLRAEQLIDPERRETVTIGTHAGVRDVLLGVSGYSVDLGRWRLCSETAATMFGEAVSHPVLGISLGSLHQVVAVPDEKLLTAICLREAAESHVGSAASGKVEFVCPGEVFLKDGVGRLAVRVFEYGVGEVPACGTDAASAALAARYWGGAEMPHNWRVNLLGGIFGVRMFPTEAGEHVALSGAAETVSVGEITLPSTV